MTATTSRDRLWPPFAGAHDLPSIEQLPLADRGLPTSTYELVTRAAALWPEGAALSVLPDADRWQAPVRRTFADLTADVHRAANVLADLGVEHGDAVAVIAVNCAELVPLLLAAEAVGIFAPINPALAAEHATELVRLAGARVIVASGPELDPVVWEHARDVAHATGARALLALRPTTPVQPAPALAPLGSTEVAYLEERMAGADARRRSRARRRRLPTWRSCLRTGGTTGTPKLAARTHANEVANAWMITCPDLFRPGSALFAALPLFHTNALLVTVLGPLLKGLHVVWAGPLGYRDRALSGHFWKIVERYRIAAMSGVPTVYAASRRSPWTRTSRAWSSRSSERPRCRPRCATRSRRIPASRSARATASPRARARARSRTAPTRGATERSVSGSHTRRRARSPCDETTGEWTFLPAGEVGTIVLRGPNVFAGYLVRGASGTELRADGKVRDGWLDTGDLGAVDEDGFIALAGRAEDLIIRGGHNIDPATIEDVLLAHPAIEAVAAVGRPDVHAGEVPVAFVVLADGASVEAAELAAWAADRVSERAAAPKHVEIVDEIPHTAVGKPYKPELRRRAAEHAATHALAGTSVHDQLHVRLVDGAIEILVPRSSDDETVHAALSSYAWSWRFV